MRKKAYGSHDRPYQKNNPVIFLIYSWSLIKCAVCVCGGALGGISVINSASFHTLGWSFCSVHMFCIPADMQASSTTSAERPTQTSPAVTPWQGQPHITTKKKKINKHKTLPQASLKMEPTKSRSISSVIALRIRRPGHLSLLAPLVSAGACSLLMFYI